MSLHGKIGTMSIPDILQWVGMGQKTGALCFYNRGTLKNLYFSEGQVISASSNNPREYLGQFLISAGKISEEDLKRAFVTQQETKILLGKILCMVGKIEEKELSEILRKKIEETVYELFFWNEGDFEFSEMTGQALSHEDLQVTVNIPVPKLVMEGARRFDEWRKMKKRFSDLDMIVRPLRELNPGKYAEGSRKRKLLELMASKKTLRELLLELRTNEVSLFNIIEQLRQGGFIEVVPGKVQKDSKLPLDPALFRQDFKTSLKQLLREKKFSEAIAYLDELIQLEDQSQELKGLRKKVEEKYLAELIHSLSPLERIVVLSMPANDIAKLELTAEEGFVISRVNGEWSLETISRISPLPQWVTLKILNKFLSENIIRLRD